MLVKEPLVSRFVLYHITAKRPFSAVPMLRNLEYIQSFAFISANMWIVLADLFEGIKVGANNCRPNVCTNGTATAGTHVHFATFVWRKESVGDLEIRDAWLTSRTGTAFACHDDVIKLTLLPGYWPFVRGIHRSPMNSSHKGQWRGALMFSLICAWTNGWVNNRDAGDLRRYRAYYDVSVMVQLLPENKLYQRTHSDTSTIIGRIQYANITNVNLFIPLATLQWRHNGLDSVSNHEPHHCLRSRLRKHQSAASLAFVWGIHRTNGQLSGKYFHLMTSSWIVSISTLIRVHPDWGHVRRHGRQWMVTVVPVCNHVFLICMICICINWYHMERGVEIDERNWKIRKFVLRSPNPRLLLSCVYIFMKNHL